VIDRAIPLGQLPVGRSAYIRRVLGRPDDVHRLEEFGLCGGIRVEMFRAGRPCIVRVGGNKVCLRGNESLHVMVEPETVD
jgi:Fe2+ transport system protein FeoA